jgi:Uma2 family endonuclease
MTAEDLWLMGEDARLELIEGVPHPVSPTTKRHAKLMVWFSHLLVSHIDQHQLGTLYAGDPGFILERDPDTVLGPDMAFVRAGGPPEEERGFSPEVPDLVIEFSSPSHRPGRMADRVRRYREFGVPVVWVLYPDSRTIAVHDAGGSRTLGEGDVLDGGDVLPGLRLPLADIFR